MTNGDYIRSLNDMQMAEFLFELMEYRDSQNQLNLANSGINSSKVVIPAIAINTHYRWLLQEHPEEIQYGDV